MISINNDSLFKQLRTIAKDINECHDSELTEPMIHCEEFIRDFLHIHDNKLPKTKEDPIKEPYSWYDYASHYTVLASSSYVEDMYHLFMNLTSPYPPITAIRLTEDHLHVYNGHTSQLRIRNYLFKNFSTQTQRSITDYCCGFMDHHEK